MLQIKKTIISIVRFLLISFLLITHAFTFIKEMKQYGLTRIYN